MWEPLVPQQPPWTLGGRWKTGECGRCLRLRHWKRVGLVFSSEEPVGGDTFVGRVLSDSSGWHLLGAFGSKQPVHGRLSIGASTATVKWPTGAMWVQEEEEMESESPVAPGRVPVLAVVAILFVLLLACGLAESYRMILSNMLISCFSIIHIFFIYRIMPWCSMLTPPGAKGLHLWIICVIVVSILMALNGASAVWLALKTWPQPYSRIYLACMTLTALCSLLSCSWARIAESMVNAQNPEEWPGLAKVPHSHAEHARAVQEFGEACSRWHHMYPFSLEVTDVFSISNLVLEASFVESHSRLASREDLNIRQLYHGTSASAAKAIIHDGFRSPWKLLGGAISFSETPLKSWQYTAKTGGCFLLVCDVALGVGQGEAEEPAVCSLENCCRAIGRNVKYDSLHGLTEEDGGVLRVPEHRVFRPAQALPTFLLKVREKHTKAV